jgi:hypothetical protein
MPFDCELVAERGGTGRFNAIVWPFLNGWPGSAPLRTPPTRKAARELTTSEAGNVIWYDMSIFLSLGPPQA